MDEFNTMDEKAKWMRPHHKKKLVFLLVLIVIVLVYLFGQKIWFSAAAKGYQAVFLTNGQVYFGKLSPSGSFYKLTDIYYLQVTQPLQQASSDASKAPTSTGTAAAQPNIQLIKLGSELHGPQDAMYIGHNQVLFWENMKSDSKVVDAINKYKAGQK